MGTRKLIQEGKTYYERIKDDPELMSYYEGRVGKIFLTKEDRKNLQGLKYENFIWNN